MGTERVCARTLDTCIGYHLYKAGSMPTSSPSSGRAHFTEKSCGYMIFIFMNHTWQLCAKSLYLRSRRAIAVNEYTGQLPGVEHPKKDAAGAEGGSELRRYSQSNVIHGRPSRSLSQVGFLDKWHILRGRYLKVLSPSDCGWPSPLV